MDLHDALVKRLGDETPDEDPSGCLGRVQKKLAEAVRVAGEPDGKADRTVSAWPLASQSKSICVELPGSV